MKNETTEKFTIGIVVAAVLLLIWVMWVIGFANHKTVVPHKTEDSIIFIGDSREYGIVSDTIDFDTLHSRIPDTTQQSMGYLDSLNKSKNYSKYRLTFIN